MTVYMSSMSRLSAHLMIDNDRRGVGIQSVDPNDDVTA